MTVGFIGLGNMGQGMVHNLLEKKADLTAGSTYPVKDFRLLRLIGRNILEFLTPNRCFVHKASFSHL